MAWILLFVLACVPPAPVRVSWGDARPLPLVQPSTDARRWYVPVELPDGTTWLWFLDTGYDVTTCDDALAEVLDLEPRGRVRIRGALGIVRAQRADLPPLRLGGHTVRGVTCHVRDLAATSSIDDPAEVKVAGVLGMDVLRRFRLTLDPEAGQILLAEPAERLPRHHSVRLRRAFWPGLGRRLRVPVHVEGRRVFLLLDTGAARTSIRGRRLGLEPDHERQIVLRGSGATGAATHRVPYFRVQALSLHGHPADPPLLMGQIHRGLRGPPGLLGLDVVRQFRTELDLPRQRARFTPVLPTPLPRFTRWAERRDPPPSAILQERSAPP